MPQLLKRNFYLNNSKILAAILCFVLILVSLSSTDLLSRCTRNTFENPYALIVLPIFIVWFMTIYQLKIKDVTITEK